MRIKHKRKEIEVPVKNLSKLGMGRGLMFSKKEKADALLFNMKNCKIHSFFVFYDFLALWLDDNNRIIEKKIVKPFSFLVYPKEKTEKLVEIPLNKKFDDIISNLVD